MNKEKYRGRKADKKNIIKMENQKKDIQGRFRIFRYENNGYYK